MRHLFLLTASVSVMALAGCATFSKSEPTPPADAAATAQKADSAATSSAQEAKEMASVMGGTPVPETDVAAKDVPPPPVADLAPDAATPNTAPAAKAAGTPVAGAPSDCPAVEVLPDTKSITYFDDPEGRPNGKMVARASLEDIKGGCDYTTSGVTVDIDMIMKGKIADAGRYQGRRDLEAFMTFPYFVAVMAPDGHMVDKKILATAMRFNPNVDDLDHAEKITQTIPLPDISQGGKYTITLGFQLNRAQLDYNRGTVSAPAKTDAAPAKTTGKKKKPAAKSDVKADADKDSANKDTVVKADAAKAETTKAVVTPAPTTPATPAASLPAAEPAASKMKPIVE